jgi:hypothetical protein
VGLVNRHAQLMGPREILFIFMGKCIDAPSKAENKHTQNYTAEYLISNQLPIIKSSFFLFSEFC